MNETTGPVTFAGTTLRLSITNADTLSTGVAADQTTLITWSVCALHEAALKAVTLLATDDY